VNYTGEREVWNTKESSFSRKRESKLKFLKWIHAFAGMTAWKKVEIKSEINL
jgi:hypothetical protein